VEQQRTSAAVQIQTLARMMHAREVVAQKIIARQRHHRAVIVREAAHVITSCLQANAARRKFLRHVANRKERERIERSTRAAVAVQTHANWQRSIALVARLFAGRFHRCTVQVQKWWKIVHARRERRRRIAIVEQEKHRQRLLEAVVTLQSYVRRFLARSAFVKRRDFSRAFPLLQRVGRAYLTRSRGALVQNRGQEMAARCIQRFSRLVRSVRLLQLKRDWNRRAKRLAHLEYAAQKIQRGWKLKVARNLAAANKIRMEERTQAARCIQHNARMWVAKAKLRRLRQTQEDVMFGDRLDRSAMRIQANFRGWRVRLWYVGVLREREGRYALLHRVAQNYLFRKDLAMYYLRNRRARAASRIQIAYRHHRAEVMADRRYRMRVSMVRGMRQREAAAVTIQRNVRCFFAVMAFQQLRRRRHSAAIQIQTQVRMMLARQVLDALIYDFRRELAARRVQMMWLATVHKFRQRREVFEYEAQLLQMDTTALYRSEANSRRDIGLQEDHFWSRESYRFETILTRLAEEYAVRLEAWRKRSPAELQQEAATKIQSVLRGHFSRSGAGTHGSTLDESDIPRIEEDDRTTDMTEDMLNRYDRQRGRDPYLPTQQNGPVSAGHANVHHDSRVASGTAVAQNLRMLSHGLMPSLLQEAAARQRKASPHLNHGDEASHGDADPIIDEPPQSWFSWLAERPELCSRSFERLLQRETSARLRVRQVFEVELALLQAQHRVPEHAHLRPILALTTRTHALLGGTAATADGGVSARRKDSRIGTLAAGADGTSLATIAPLVRPSELGNSSTTTPRSRGVLLPPMLRPNSHAALHSHHVASIVTSTYPPSRAEALRDVMDLSREAATAATFQRVSLAMQTSSCAPEPEVSHKGAVAVAGSAWGGDDGADMTTANRALTDDDHYEDDGDERSEDDSHSQQVLTPRRQHDAAATDAAAAACDLRSLNLSDTQLSLILEKLRSNAVFTALYLDNNRTHLVSSVMRSPHVLVVDLRGTMVTEAYRKHLSNLLNRNIARARQAREQREREEALLKQADGALRGDAQLLGTTHRTGFAALRSLPPSQPSAAAAVLHGTPTANGGGALAPVRTGRSAATAMKQNRSTAMGFILEAETAL
jgi:hypothetical protein